MSGGLGFGGPLGASERQSATSTARRGTTYEMRWDVYGDEDEFPVVGVFSFVNQIEVVKSGGESGRGN